MKHLDPLLKKSGVLTVPDDKQVKKIECA